MIRTPLNQLQLLQHALIATLMLLLGWQLAWWTWHFIAPSLKTTSTFNAGTATVPLALGRQLFGDAGPAVAAVSNNSPIGIRLKGVFAVDGKTLSGAVLNMGARDQYVRQGQELSPGVTLVEVRRDYVILNRAGVREKIDMDRFENRGAKPATASTMPATQFRLNVTSSGPNNYALSRQELNSVLGDPRQQVFFNGRMAAASGGGIRIEEAPGGSLLDKLGIKTGDVITAINGQPVNSQGDLVRLYTQFGSLANIRAEVRRGGAPVMLSYSIQN
jgi:general secretion pathway protein C